MRLSTCPFVVVNVRLCVSLWKVPFTIKKYLSAPCALDHSNLIEVLDIAFAYVICEVAGTASKKKLHEFKMKQS